MKLLKIKKALPLLALLIPTIFSSCEKEIFTEAEEKSTINNSLILESNPTNALIYLNNRNSGLRTPGSLTWLQDGAHTITLKHEFFIDTTITLTLNGGKETKLVIDYYKNPGHLGKLSCQTHPEKAAIHIDGKPTGKFTPHTFSGMLPGMHKVKYTYPMHRTDSLEIAVIGGALKTAYMFLDDTTKGLYHTTINSNITTDYTYCVAVDSSNIKWIGTEGQGIIRFDGKKWSVINTNNSPIPSNVIKSLYVDKSNRVWIGFDIGLCVYNGGIITNYSSQVNNKMVTSINSDNSGNIWIGAFGGLTKFNGSSWFTFTRENSGLLDDYIYTIAVDKQNSIWVGTNGKGIAVYDGAIWKKWDMTNMGIGTRIGDVIHSLVCDNDGNIWAAHMREETGTGIKAEGGLSRFNGAKWSIISVPQISTQYILSLHVDRSNNKWAATKFGLGKFDKLNAASLFTKVNAKLQTSLTTASALDKLGDLYITTLGGGLSKFRKGSF
ncbi:MAG: two-component regulator propeller domain-containing protein [Bacteroidota bacterium]